MKIAILGAGNVGGTLGRAWASKGHDIVFGVPEPKGAKMSALLGKIGPKASAHSVADAARSAELVVLATPWNATKEALESAGSLAGKTVIDCTNPLKPDLSGLTVGNTSSGAEQVAQWARGASVFKALNTTGAENMGLVKSFATPPVMFVCGDDAARKPAVIGLVKELGFDTIDAGGLAVARLLEPMALLWIHLALARKQGPDFAFALARRGR